MGTYRVYFKGYADVIADSEEEATEKFDDEDIIQSEREVTSVECLDEEDAVFVVNVDEILNK